MGASIKAAAMASAAAVVMAALLWPTSNCIRAALPVGQPNPNTFACRSVIGVPSNPGVALLASSLVSAAIYVLVRRRQSIAAAMRLAMVDARAVVGTVGVVTCLAALAVVRGAHLYDEKFNDNLGMFYTTALVLLGAVVAFGGFWKSTVNDKWRRAGLAIAAVAVAVVVFVAAHPDNTCVLRCGLF